MFSTYIDIFARSIIIDLFRIKTIKKIAILCTLISLVISTKSLTIQEYMVNKNKFIIMSDCVTFDPLDKLEKTFSFCQSNILLHTI